MRDEEAPGPLTPASAPKAPGRPGREVARAIGRGTHLIGQSLRRLEDPRLLRGEARFVDDLRPEGCRHVAFVRSPVANGRIRNVAADFTAADLEGTCWPLVVHLTTPGAVSPPRPLIAVDRVRFVGEICGAVVAEDRYAAADAVEG